MTIGIKRDYTKGEWVEERSPFTGKKINVFKIRCKCGHTISFVSNHYSICNHCGRKVYPTKKSEFKDKLLKEVSKK